MSKRTLYFSFWLNTQRKVNIVYFNALYEYDCVPTDRMFACIYYTRNLVILARLAPATKV